MDGYSRPATPPYGLGDVIDYLHSASPTGDYRRQNQFNPSPQWSEQTAHSANSNGLFNWGLPEDSYRARCYAQALEFYLLENEFPEREPYLCPMATCPALAFESLKGMLRHLKTCQSFTKEGFMPFTNYQFGSPRVQAPKRHHSWDKHLGQFMQRSKRVFRSFAGNRLNTQQTQGQGPYPKFPGQSLDTMAYNNSHASLFSQISPSQRTVPALLPPNPPTATPEDQCAELDPTNCFFELPVDSDMASSRAQSQSEATTYDSSRSGSINSMASVSTNPTSTNVSPTAPTPFHLPFNDRSREVIIPRHVRPSAPSYNEAGLNLDYSFPGLDSVPKFCPFPPPSNIYDMSVSPTSVDPPAAQFGSQGMTNPQPATTGQYSPRPSSPVLDLTSQSVLLDESQDMDNLAEEDCPELSWAPVSDMVEGESINPLVIDTSLPQLANSAATTPATPSPLDLGGQSPTADEEIKCSLCNFKPSGRPHNLKAYLRKHVQSSHRMKRFIVCERCGKKFTRRDNLRAHHRKRHAS
ncbi:hypothetical protein GGR50DRAFT_695471 [Xylaria sp. CBS 124048]|nr:hypothetical protein GGR50DRAFT_695471 [Xylaria sp. CBS 124048]